MSEISDVYKLSSFPCTILESLPDEIFFEIFEYLSVQDLYNGFYNINYRFRTILESLTHLSGDVTFEEELDSLSFRLFASRITTLYIRCIDVIDISPFSAVHSLVLYIEPNRTQCQWIQLFPCLKYLYILQRPIKHYYYSVSLPLFVFTNAYPNLLTCKLNLISYRIRQDWTCVPSLKTLSVIVENPRVFTQILESCPYLVRLKFELTQHFTRPPNGFDIPPHRLLRRFDLGLNQTMFSCCDIMEPFLSLIPNLTTLIVQGLSSTAHFINIHLLASILQRHVPILSHFNFNTAIEESIAKTLVNCDKQNLEELHPLFTNICIYPSTRKVAARLTIGI